MKLLFHLLALWLVAIAFGCHKEGEVAGTVRNELAGQIRFVPTMAPKGKNVYERKKWSEMSPEEQEMVDEESKKATIAAARIERIIDTSQDWKTGDNRVRRELAAVKQNPFLWRVEQSAANNMLTTLLLPGEMTSEKQDAIAFYLAMLLRNEHPDAQVILQGLEAMRGKWSQEEISGAAHAAVRFARSYLEKNPCIPCVQQTGVAPELLDAREQKLFQIHRSIPKLEKLSLEK